MIALKQFSVKIGKNTYRLNAGKVIPENIIAFWKSTKEIDELKKLGVIGDGSQKSTFETQKENNISDKDK